MASKSKRGENRNEVVSHENVQSLTPDEAAVLGFPASRFFRLSSFTDEEPNITPITEILFREYTLLDLNIENRLQSFEA